MICSLITCKNDNVTSVQTEHAIFTASELTMRHNISGLATRKCEKSVDMMLLRCASVTVRLKNHLIMSKPVSNF